MKHVKGIDKRGTLMDKTLKLLNNDKRSLIEIFAETGVPLYWLRKFSIGAFKSPSVNRVQSLYEILSGEKIFDKNKI